jgi:hypothetical protein
MKNPFIRTIAFGAIISGANAAITVNYGNTSGGLLRDSNGTALTMGGKEIGDGAIIQIGYYSLGTTASPFAGEWVPVIGAGASIAGSTVGDGIGGSGLFDGQFAGSATFSPSTLFPTQATPFVIRFYDGTTLGSSTHYNAVTAAGWTWPNSVTTERNLQLGAPNDMVWEGGSGSAYWTTIAVVPEPSSLGILALSGALILARRKR